MNAPRRLTVMFVLTMLFGGVAALCSQDPPPPTEAEVDLSLEEVIAALSDSFQEAEAYVVEAPTTNTEGARGIGGRKKLIRQVADVQVNLLNKASADGLCISSMVAKIEVRIGKTTDGIKVTAAAPKIGQASVGVGAGETVATATVEVTCINPKCRET